MAFERWDGKILVGHVASRQTVADMGNEAVDTMEVGRGAVGKRTVGVQLHCRGRDPKTSRDVFACICIFKQVACPNCETFFYIG